MPTNPTSLGFLGDFSDPWVDRIRSVLPGHVQAVHVEGPIGVWSKAPAAPAFSNWVVHRPEISPSDLTWFQQVHSHRTSEGTSGYIILITGPHVRFHQVQRVLPWIDRLLNEAVAPYLLPVQAEFQSGAGRMQREFRSHHSVGLVGHSHEILATLDEACAIAGYRVLRYRGSIESSHEEILLWEPPVLESGWADVLKRLTNGSRRTVIPLLGLPDRALVREAEAAGAAACLELPCDPEDLIAVLDRYFSLAKVWPGRLDSGRSPWIGPHANPGRELTSPVGRKPGSSYDDRGAVES